jgi:L-lactate dehydrogenase complex protein LldG
MTARSTTGGDLPPPETLLPAFTDRAGSLGVRVARVADPGAASEIVAALALETGAERVIVAAELRDAAPQLVAAMIAGGVTIVSPDAPADADGAPLGVSLAALAIAETGSMLLAEPTLNDRAIGLLSATQIIICPTSALVPSLDEAAPVLREVASRPGASYATLVTGPSRTADIERVLTVGVQGPARVVVIFVDQLA